MRTVNEVSKLTGVSIRTLQYYDTIGLLIPAQRTEAGYRLYDDTALERMEQILLFRELGFSLSEIKTIIDDPKFDRMEALDRQIELLTMKKERLEQIIGLAREIRQKGEIIMDVKAVDTKQIEEYKKRAKEQWGDSAEYKEYEKKADNRTADESKKIADEFMQIFAEFGKLKDMDTNSEEVRSQVKKLQAYITDNYYSCSDEMLCSLGQMYCADNEFRKNIDSAGGDGTAEFVSKAIAVCFGK